MKYRTYHTNSKNHSAFTLIELSIVLVIIGLIVGGVLVARDLIESAKLRSAVKQIQEFDTALNVFRLKYDCLPGDCRKVRQFGMASRASSTSCGTSNENGILESRFTCGDSTEIRGDEFVLFWNDLLRADLIESNGLDASLNHINWSCNTDDSCTPRSKLNNEYISIYQQGGIAYYFLKNFPGFSGGSSKHQLNPRPALTALQAYSWDTKADDGQPLSGRFTIIDDVNGNTSAGISNPTPSASACITSLTEYNLSNDYADVILCDISIRMGNN